MGDNGFQQLRLVPTELAAHPVRFPSDVAREVLNATSAAMRRKVHTLTAAAQAINAQ